MAKKRKEIQEVANQISKRMFLVGSLQIGFGLILIGRLYQLQILHILIFVSDLQILELYNFLTTLMLMQIHIIGILVMDSHPLM